jgi:uncharacterized protein (DUF302 family)
MTRTLKTGLTALAAAAALSACATTVPVNSPDRHSAYMSDDSFAVVEARLRDGIAARPLTLFTVVDHGAGADRVGTPIGQSKLFIVGNPEVGTPFMVADPQMGLDLPLKILIHSVPGGTHLAYSHPGEAAMRHGVFDQVEPQVERIHTVMEGLLSEAGGDTVALAHSR